MLTFARELRHAWRSLLQRKPYFITCAATLTIVLGANAAIFAVVNATLLRPMPFATHGEVLQLFDQPPGTTAVLQRNPLQQMEVARLRQTARTLARIEGFLLSERVITRSGRPDVAQTAAVTPGLLPMVAAPVSQGRLFFESEGGPGQFVAVISDRYWRDTLGANNALGASLVIDNQPHTIVGILSPSFAVPFVDANIYTPLYANPEAGPRAPPKSVVSLAEVAPGATIEQARDELEAISAQMSQEFPRTHTGWTYGAVTAREWQYGSIRPALLMLFAATGFVLLIACVNIANLTTAQAIARSGELSLRLALGATRADVVRMHLAELLIVGASGLIPGLLLASAAVPALLAIDPTFARTLGPIEIDWRVLLLSAAMAIVTAMLASAAPAIRAMRGSISHTIAATGLRTTGSPIAARLQRALVSIEVALCLALLMAGAVLIQGLRDLAARGPGYESSGIVTAQIRLPEAEYKTAPLRVAVVDRILDGIRALPGVESAAITQNAFQPNFSYQTLINVKERPTPDGQAHTVQYRRITPDYFKTMRIPTLQGRVFGAEDAPDRPPVAVISKKFADQLLPGLDPIGQVLTRNNPVPLTIVGVVEDVSDVTVIQSGEATLYVPWSQNNNFGVPVAFVVRASVDPTSLLPGVREVVGRVDAALPLRKPQLLDVFIEESTAPERFRTMVLGVVAMLGLLLAAVGISGVTYRGVVDRTKEFAVRLALGSEPGAVVALVLKESARDLLAGALAGVAVGAALCGLLARSLSNVGAASVVTTAAAIAVLAVVGFAAAFLPALRVRRVQPAAVLRS
jgi:putative ABC transport system permease protein